MSVHREKPGILSYLMVLRLLGVALIDLVLLPFRLAWFLLNKKKVSGDINRLLKPPKDP
jgi:hypothetical protein